MKVESDSGFWAIVSLMGHQTLAGYVEEVSIGSSSFMRITIPETGTQPKWQKLFTDKAVYSIDIVDEQTATERASQINSAPVQPWSAISMVKKQLEGNGQLIVRKEDLPDGFALPLSSVTEVPFENNYDNDDEGPF